MTNIQKRVIVKKPNKVVQHAIMALNTFLLSIIGLIVVIFFLQATRNTQKYFIYDKKQDTKLEIFPLLEPNINTKTLLRWVTTAVTSAYTMDFYNYQTNLDSLKEYFTKAGYINFLASLEQTKRVEDIIEKKLIVTAVLTDTPVVLQEGLLRGNYSWRVQLPLLINYQGASETSSQYNITVTVLITKVPTIEATKGIGIVQLTDQLIGQV